MPTSLRFYRDLLGFKVVSTSPMFDEDCCHWAWLRLGEADLMLNIAYEFDNEHRADLDPVHTSAHGDTGLFFGCQDVDTAYEQLRGKVVKVKPPVVARYGMKQMSLRDPDGYGLCFQWSAPDSELEAK